MVHGLAAYHAVRQHDGPHLAMATGLNAARRFGTLGIPGQGTEVLLEHVLGQSYRVLRGAGFVTSHTLLILKKLYGGRWQQERGVWPGIKALKRLVFGRGRAGT
jgi:hypothetical protein